MTYIVTYTPDEGTTVNVKIVEAVDYTKAYLSVALVLGMVLDVQKWGC